MDNQVSFIAHEAMMARMERTIKRLWILLIILIVALIASNAAWILYESQYEDSAVTITRTVTQDAESGSNQYIGGDYYGEANRNDN